MKNGLKTLLIGAGLLVSSTFSHAAVIILGNPSIAPIGGGTYSVGCNQSQYACAVVWVQRGQIHAVFTGDDREWVIQQRVTGDDKQDEAQAAATLQNGGAEAVPL